MWLLISERKCTKTEISERKKTNKYSKYFSAPKVRFRSKFNTWFWTPSNTFLHQKWTPRVIESIEESIETKFISEIGLERNSENSIMEITGFDRYVMGGKVTVMKDLIICTYPEARILKRFQLRLIFLIFNQKVKIVFPRQFNCLLPTSYWY